MYPGKYKPNKPKRSGKMSNFVTVLSICDREKLNILKILFENPFYAIVCRNSKNFQKRSFPSCLT